MKNRVAVFCAGALVLVGSSLAAERAGETFTATASVKSEGAATTSPVKISIQRFATEAQRKSVMSAIKSGGSPALRGVVVKMPDAGTIEVGGRRTTIKYAFTRPAGAGRLVTAVTAEPILYLGAGMPESKTAPGHDVAVALLVLEGNDTGHGELAPAAKVGTNASGALVVEDYGTAKIWLKGVAKAK